MCPKQVEPNTTSIGRGGAVAEYVSNVVILCGGRDKQNRVRDDCMEYNPRTNEWEFHSNLLELREEAASAVLADQMYLLGGMVNGEIIRSSEKLSGDAWTNGPSLPEGRARYLVQISIKSLELH